jgi:hypothetical protein
MMGGSQKGQLEIGFVLRVAVGFVMLMGLIHITDTMLSRMGQYSERKGLVVVGEYVKTNIIEAMKGLKEGESVTKEFHLPGIGSGYRVTGACLGSERYLRFTSVRWPSIDQYQPLYLNCNEVLLSGTSYPEEMCITVSRNATAYDIDITC